MSLSTANSLKVYTWWMKRRYDLNNELEFDGETQSVASVCTMSVDMPLVLNSGVEDSGEVVTRSSHVSDGGNWIRFGPVQAAENPLASHGVLGGEFRHTTGTWDFSNASLQFVSDRGMMDEGAELLPHSSGVDAPSIDEYAMHKYLLYFMNPKTEQRYFNFQYVDNAFIPGKIFATMWTGIFIISSRRFHTALHRQRLLHY
jgi:hypothetical protein